MKKKKRSINKVISVPISVSWLIKKNGRRWTECFIIYFVSLQGYPLLYANSAPCFRLVRFRHSRNPEEGRRDTDLTNTSFQAVSTIFLAVTWLLLMIYFWWCFCDFLLSFILYSTCLNCNIWKLLETKSYINLFS